MFSTKEQLIKRTGNSGVGRYEFLKLLVNEFQTTTSKESKEQVLANLTNFAYDPINYDYIRRLRIIDIFLRTLTETNQTLVQYAIAGICNLCLDPLNKEYILQNQGIHLISSLLFSQNEQIILSSVTTLMYLITLENRKEITASHIIKRVQDLSTYPNIRIKNIATIFLNDYCDTSIIGQSEKEGQNSATSIEVESLNNLNTPNKND